MIESFKWWHLVFQMVAIPTFYVYVVFFVLCFVVVLSLKVFFQMVCQAWVILVLSLLLAVPQLSALSGWIPKWVWRGSKNWGWGERDYEGMIDEMKIFYQEMLFPLEEKYRYHSFHSPALNDADFGAKPLVMLVGQYSTGKTSFIRYLLGQVISSLMNDP